MVGRRHLSCCRVRRPAEEVREVAGLRLSGQSSMKAALGLDRDDPDVHHRALQEQVVGQDLEPDPDRGGERIAAGPAKDQPISIHDTSMRHGRQSRSTVIRDFQRLIARDLEHGLIVGVTVQPANQREHEGTEVLRRLVEVHG